MTGSSSSSSSSSGSGVVVVLPDEKFANEMTGSSENVKCVPLSGQSDVLQARAPTGRSGNVGSFTGRTVT